MLEVKRIVNLDQYKKCRYTIIIVKSFGNEQLISILHLEKRSNFSKSVYAYGGQGLHQYFTCQKKTEFVQVSENFK